jgi:PAS domain S-box-containing protein
MGRSNAAGSVNDLSVARALTWRYVIALSLVATLSTAAWVSLHLVISEQQSTAAVVNVSGRQRMLSQRTALFSNLLVNTPIPKRPLVRAKLKEAIDLMARSHRGLTRGDQEMGLPDTMSPAVRAMYFDGPDALDGQVETYIKTVRALLLLDDGALIPENPLLQHITRTAPTTLVTALDQMVRQYQLEGETSVGRLQKAETIFWVVTLLLLALEALLIFHPFVRHVRNIIGKLQGVSDELQLQQGHLEELVGQRTADLENRGKELAESEEKFRLISTAAKDAIAIIGTDEQVIYWNPAAEKVFGYMAEEAVGKNLHNLLTPANYRDAAHTGFNLFRHSGEGNFIGKTFEITALRKSGEEFPVELSISAISLKNSWHALGIIRDISERKKAEEALRNSEALFRSMFAKHTAVMLLIEPLTGEILEGNKAAEEFYGYPASRLCTMNIEEINVLPPDQVTQERQRALQLKRNYFVFPHRLESGEIRTVEVHSSPIALENRQILFSIIHDITERKKAEDKINEFNRDLERLVAARTTDLVAANKELEDFSYSVSHDLRTPLRAIDGYSHMLLEDHAGKLDDDGKRLLGVVRNNTRRMSHLIDGILHFLRAGRAEMSLAETDMERVVRDVLDRLKPLIGERRLQINIGSLPQALCDRAMMHQVIESLLSNAVKFTAKAEDARIEIGGRIEGDEAIYYVKDNGAGFDMQYADKLFGVFQRLHGVDEFEGAGIGLAITKRIITRQGGRVWAEGKVNEGATIYFALQTNAAAHV